MTKSVKLSKMRQYTEIFLTIFVNTSMYIYLSAFLYDVLFSIRYQPMHTPDHSDMDDLRTSGVKFGVWLKQEPFWLEALSDDQDGDKGPESNNEQVSSVAEVNISTRTCVLRFVCSKLVVLLFGLVYMWTGCYFTYLGSLPRIAFGRGEAEGFAISLAGIFTVSFVFFCLLFTALLLWFPCSRRFWWVGVICAVPPFLWVVVLGFVNLGFGSSAQLLSSCPFFALLVAMNHVYMNIFFCQAQLHFHAKHLWGFVEAMRALGGCLGLFLERPTGTFSIVLVVVCVNPLLLQWVYGYIRQLLVKNRYNTPIPIEDTYWYTIFTRVIRNRSFWAITGYCVFCNGPFLSVSYWWCSMYFVDIYGLHDWFNNLAVGCLWVGVIFGSVYGVLLGCADQLSKWFPFFLSGLAFISILCLTVIPCWRTMWLVFLVPLILLGMSAGSCRSIAYTLYLEHFGVVASCFAMSLTTSLTVLSGFVFHLISYSLLSLYVSSAKSGSMAERLNAYQFAVWLPCVICFGIASFAVVWVNEPSCCRKVTVKES